MCSVPCWILYIWEALGYIFFAFWAWFMHCQQEGEVWACFGLLNAFRRFSSGFELFLGPVVHWSGQSSSPVWPVRVLVLCTCWAPVWPVVATGLTGQSWADVAALFSSSGLYAFIQVGCIGLGGACMCVGGSSLWFFELSFGLVVFALCLSIFLSWMCRAVSLA
jgi:hypothetical protein